MGEVVGKSGWEKWLGKVVGKAGWEKWLGKVVGKVVGKSGWDFPTTSPNHFSQPLFPTTFPNHFVFFCPLKIILKLEILKLEPVVGTTSQSLFLITFQQHFKSDWNTFEVVPGSLWSPSKSDRSLLTGLQSAPSTASK